MIPVWKLPWEYSRMALTRHARQTIPKSDAGSVMNVRTIVEYCVSKLLPTHSVNVDVRNV